MSCGSCATKMPVFWGYCNSKREDAPEETASHHPTCHEQVENLDAITPSFPPAADHLLASQVPTLQAHELISQEAKANVIHNRLSKRYHSACPPTPPFPAYNFQGLRSQGCSISATRTDTIPPYLNSTRRPANIPLHTLSSASRPLQREESSRSLIDDPDEKGSSTSADSDFSLWSDTGDLVDQLADQEDPLRSRLRDPLPQTSGQRRGRPHKQVRYHPDVEDNEKKAAALRKEDIHIPVPPQRKINFGERVLVAIMAPNDGPSRIHGLHGKKLMYAFSTFRIDLR